MDRATLATLVGSALGAAAGGVGGYAMSDKRKGKRARNALLAAIAGGAVGAYAGRVGNAHLDFVRRRAAATRIPDGEKAVPGRVYFVDYPDNAIDVSQTGIPQVDAVASKLKRLTGWSGRHRIGHAGILTVDGDGNAVRYDYGLYGKGAANPEVLTRKFNLKGMDDAAIARAMQWDGWGDRVGLYGTNVGDIGVVRRYMEGLTSPGAGAGFSPVPGGTSCSTAARNAFEAARGGVTGHLLDLLWGGYPTANAPVHGTRQTHFRKESAYAEGLRKTAEAYGVSPASVVKSAAGLLLAGAPIYRPRRRSRHSSSLGDTVSNTWDALSSGQLPVPFLTVGDRRVNAPITAKPGEPVYVVMSGADPGSQSQISDGLFYRTPGSTDNNQLAYRWFDRAQATRDAVRYARAGHPVRIVGESYGGVAASDVANRMVAKGLRPDMLVMYDPVSRGRVSAPTNMAHEAVNIQPHYGSPNDGDNLLARIGGRHPGISGARTVPWYGGPHESFGPKNSVASHFFSRYPLRHAVQKMDADDAKRLAEAGTASVAKPSVEQPQVSLVGSTALRGMTQGGTY